jgi:hypothetical protein
MAPAASIDNDRRFSVVAPPVVCLIQILLFFALSRSFIVVRCEVPDKMVLESEMMAIFRRSMFKRIIPNLKRIGLLSDRIRHRYQELGMLVYEKEKAAPELIHKEIMEGD